MKWQVKDINPPPPPGPQEAPSGCSKIFSQNSNPFHPLIVNQQFQLSPKNSYFGATTEM